ncbi:hypothetical protein WA026_014154 [Henosepilachna vigintioctopunctata]|uniref:Uncharacterized protein n=1 Tax=Henosepilachna vigintioctopunctata TaxID=420089 RepID=A0AAW1TTQ5_9CUCU
MSNDKMAKGTGNAFIGSCSKLSEYREKKFGRNEENSGINTGNVFSAVFLTGKNFSKTEWFIDSGASVHLTANKHVK